MVVFRGIVKNKIPELCLIYFSIATYPKSSFLNNKKSDTLSSCSFTVWMLCLVEGKQNTSGNNKTSVSNLAKFDPTVKTFLKIGLIPGWQWSCWFENQVQGQLQVAIQCHITHMMKSSFSIGTRHMHKLY